ncbi:MAG: right-handed parallel beta-helix repeat-containing protein [Thermoplasmata archaeon]|nr:MAG: right-handed parallel beta-helix repeat-containing protein [Thermoplasmata archaeon]
MSFRKFIVTWLICALLIPTSILWMPEPISIIDNAIGTQESGNIEKNTTWTLAMSPIIITSHVNVVNNSILTIQPGVRVLFNTGNSLIITEGTLIAGGTNTQPIYFGPSGTKTKGYWGSITFREKASVNSYLKRCIIEYGTYGINASDKTSNGVKGQSIEISYCTIKDNSVDGIRCYGSSPVIEHNMIFDNTNHAIYLMSYLGTPTRHSDPLIRNNSINDGSVYSLNNNNFDQTFAVDAQYNAWDHYIPVENDDYNGNVSVANYINIDVKGGYIDTNTTWASSDLTSKIRLITPVYVEEGETLTIDQDDTNYFNFSFDNSIDIVIRGKLSIEGLNKDKFYMKDNNQEIYFWNTSENNLITNVTLNNGISIYMSNLILFKNTIDTPGNGIYTTYNYNNVKINENYIKGNANYGIYINGGGTYEITNNTIESNDKGIYCDDSNADITIRNNTIISNSNEGIYSVKSNTESIHYNHIHNNKIGIKIVSGSSATIKYNNIYSNTDFGVHSSKSITAEECYWGHKSPFDNDDTAPSDANSNVNLKDPYYITLDNTFSVRLDLNWTASNCPLFDSYQIYRKSSKTGDTIYQIYQEIEITSKHTYIDRELYHNEQTYYTYYYKVYVHTTIGFDLGSNVESSQVTNQSSGLIAEWNPLFMTSEIAGNDDELYCTYFIDADTSDPNNWQSYFYVYNPTGYSATFDIWYYDMDGIPLGTSPYLHTVNSYETLETSPDSDLGQPNGDYWEGRAVITNISGNGGLLGQLIIENIDAMIGGSQKLHHTNDTIIDGEYLYVPYFEDNSDPMHWQTELSLINTDSSEIDVIVRYYYLNGTQYVPPQNYTHTIESNSVEKWKPGDDLDAGAQEVFKGSIEIEIYQSPVIGSIMRYNYSLEKMELEPMLKRISADYITQVNEWTSGAKERTTTIYLKNIGDQNAIVNVTYYDSYGNVISSGGQSTFSHTINSHAVESWKPTDDLNGIQSIEATAIITLISGSDVVGITIQNFVEYTSKASASIPLYLLDSEPVWATYFNEDSGHDSFLYLTITTPCPSSVNVNINYYTMSALIIDYEIKTLNKNGSLSWSPDDNINIYPQDSSANGNIEMYTIYDWLIGNILLLNRELYPI